MKSILLGSGLLVMAVGVWAAEPRSDASGYGPNPALPAPHHTLIPTIKVAPAKGWSPGVTPKPANGLAVAAFAADLNHPRFIFTLPNGDVLVAETNAPERPEETAKLKGKIMALEMKKAGAAVPSANRITLLRDADGDGVAETRVTFLENLHSPFGVALVRDQLYIANTDAVVRVPYHPGDTKATAAPVKVTDLPAGPLNHHWTKTIVASRDGTKLYASVGSNSNVAENGLEQEEGRACIYEIDLASGQKRILASGLRNAVGLAIQPQSGALWAAVNERDELGNDLVPDYMTEVKAGAFYGWPFSYFGQHVDARVKPPNPARVAEAIKPDYALGAHTACLGLNFYEGKLLPQRFAGGAVIGQHGSWNRKPPSGYKVIFVPFQDGKPAGPPEELLTDFLDAEGNARGRPVGVAVDGRGAILVADDVGNAIWRVSPTAAQKPEANQP
jgi:glucose/arabinose dehydrogenase